MQEIIEAKTIDNFGAPKQFHCGEVFVWNFSNCNRKYACFVECTLCEDRPSCSFDEFEKHLEIWHTDWTAKLPECELIEEEKEFSSSGSEAEAEEEEEEEYEAFEPFEEVFIINETEELEGSDENESDFQKSHSHRNDFYFVKPQMRKNNERYETYSSNAGEMEVDDGNVFERDSEEKVEEIGIEEKLKLSRRMESLEDFQKTVCVAEVQSETQTEEEEKNFELCFEKFLGGDGDEKVLRPEIQEGNEEKVILQEETVEENKGAYVLEEEILKGYTNKNFLQQKVVEENNTNSFLRLDILEENINKMNLQPPSPDKSNDHTILPSEDSGFEKKSLNSTETNAETSLNKNSEKSFTCEEPSEDSGVDKSDISSITASLTQLDSDEENSFDFNQLDVKDQVKFGCDELQNKAKLTSVQMEKLIELFKEHPRLWQQTHIEYNNPKLCRQSWQKITSAWNRECNLDFAQYDVRTRISTLRQRFLKERERREWEYGANDMENSTKEIKSHFRYYDQLKFLDTQDRAPLKARALQMAEENTKLIEVFATFPLLWDRKEMSRKSCKQRKEAYDNLTKALQLAEVFMPTNLARQRFTNLKKRYRVEKTRHLRSQVDGTFFESSFKHYEQMKFLEKHVPPFVCNVCGKIFEKYVSYEIHKKSEKEDAPEKFFDEISKEKLSSTQVSTSAEDNGIPNQPCSDSYYQEQSRTANKPPTATPLVARIEFDGFTHEVNLETPKASSNYQFKPHAVVSRLAESHIRKLIGLYSNYPQLWDPDHMHYKSRRIRRIAWRAIASQMNEIFKEKYTWTQLQRKMIDHRKYYRQEKTRIEIEETTSPWIFYNDFSFLNSVTVSNLEKSIQKRSQTLNIIEIYFSHPQLWDTTSRAYTKRKERTRSLAMMCARLQEAHNITMGHQNLKQALQDLRQSFRTTRLERIAAEKRGEAYSPKKRFEFYDALQFLEQHVPPFICPECKMEFERHTNFTQHQRKEHKTKKWQKYESISNDNICHVCGIKFTLRHNLIQHLNRHYNERMLQCSVCEKKFYTKASLITHERIHSKIPAVICAECGRPFVNTSKLNQHMKRHRNQRDFPCDRCEKAFFTAFELDRHIRHHLNIRDKICPVCSKAFVMGSAYYAHLKLHNDKKQYSCPVCKLEFAQYAGLYKHRKKHHPKQ